VRSPSLESSMQGPALNQKFGEQEISGFVDDVARGPTRYLYANWGNMKIGRAQLNGGSARLNFLKWDGTYFETTGIGGPESSILPVNGSFQNCLAPQQNQFGSSISYVEQTHQYLLTFVCISNGDPKHGRNPNANPGAAWFYATSYDLCDPNQWTQPDPLGNPQPREIEGSWSEFTVLPEPSPSPSASPTDTPCADD